MLRQALAVCSIALLAGMCSEIGVLESVRNLLGEIRFAAFLHQPSGAIVLVESTRRALRHSDSGLGHAASMPT